MPKTWGDIYHMHLRKGEDHGYAAHMADKYCERNKIDRPKGHEMNADEYTAQEDPRPLNLGNCTGCGEPQRYVGARKGTHCQNCGKPYAATPTAIAPDAVAVPRALLVELRREVENVQDMTDLWTDKYYAGLVERLDALLSAPRDDA